MISEEETVVFIEFDQDHPCCQVVTQEQRPYGLAYHCYDFVNSKRFGLLYDYTGTGPAESLFALFDRASVDEQGTETPIETLYWAAPGIAVKESKHCKRLDTLPEPFKLDTLFDGLTTIYCEYGIVWCSECQDWMPDFGPDYCEHIWNCWICDVVSTPDERCGHPRGAEEEVAEGNKQ